MDRILCVRSGGTATRLALNLTISLFGLFYLMLAPGETWEAVRPYIPFSAKNTEKLRQRFRDVTTSTIVGTGATAAIQGFLVGLGFWLTGLPNAVFWVWSPWCSPSCPSSAAPSCGGPARSR